MADAFDSMSSNRPYRVALSRDDAIAELHRCTGSQFDGDCVAALERSVEVIDGELAERARETTAVDGANWG